MPLPTLMQVGKLVGTSPEKTAALATVKPIRYIVDWFLERESKQGISNRVLILKSETASGKSTLLPPELYKELIYAKPGHEKGAGLICTQPRVITAIANVLEMLVYNSAWLIRGKNIGWSTQSNKIRPAKYGLLSATIGTLAQILKSSTDEQIMSQFRVIMIDETHERDLQTDFTIYMLKNFLKRCGDNPACPFVVLMSATFEPQRFLEYFGVDIETNYIYCKGQAAGFTEYWDYHPDIAKPGARLDNIAADIIRDIVTKHGLNDEPNKGDIMVFVPSRSDYSSLQAKLAKLNEKQSKDEMFSVSFVDGTSVRLEDDDYQRVMFLPLDQQRQNGNIPRRRIIVCTNVAETGLTISSLKYVIDYGYNREIEFNPHHNLRMLLSKVAPKSRGNQRRGRAGRHFPGVYYPLYPSNLVAKLPENQLPAILTDDATSIMLSIILEQLRAKSQSGVLDPSFDPCDIDMLNAPATDTINSAMRKLYKLGLITPFASPYLEPTIKDGKMRIGLTPLGHIIENVAFMGEQKYEKLRMIVAAFSWEHMPLDLVTIATYLGFSKQDIPAEATKPIKWEIIYEASMPKSARLPYDARDFYQTRLLLGDEFIEGLLLFIALKKQVDNINYAQARAKLAAFCKQTNVNLAFAIKFMEQREELIHALIAAELDIFRDEHKSFVRAVDTDLMSCITRIKHCIYDGFRENLLIDDVAKKQFRTVTGLVVKTPEIFAQKAGSVDVDAMRPRYMLYCSIGVKLDRKNNIFYTIKTDRISVMDGFVPVDESFGEY